tara:strand:+ start:31 stop:174 length:144 start_codon:yes stop_codon:yes gene_type:complete
VKGYIAAASYQLSGFYGPLLKHFFRVILPAKNNLKKSLQLFLQLFIK